MSRGHRHVVLLIEDHVDARESLAMLLDVDGFDVRAVATGGEGLALLRAGGAYCFVVLDWRLPDMEGRDFLLAKNTGPHGRSVPVLVLSGDTRARAESLNAGAAYFLLKPCDPVVLAALLADHCPRQRRSKLAG